MPSLPRIRRTRAHARDSDVVRQPPGSAELTAHGLTWIHLDRPTQDEAAALAERFGWHPLDVEDVLSKRQRPKIDEYADYRFVVLHFPVYDKAIGAPERRRARLLHRPELPRHAAERRAAAGHAPVRALPRRTRSCATACSRRGPATCSTTCSTTSSTTASRSSTRSATSSTGSRTRCSRGAPRRSSATSPTSSRRSSPTARSSSRSAPRCGCSSGTSTSFLPEELELYFDDIVDAAERIWDLLDNYKEVVEALEDTNESVISHRQNDVLRLLTLISVTMLPLSVIASVFGMNVAFPGEGTHEAFWMIIGADRGRAGLDGRRSSATSAGSRAAEPRGRLRSPSSRLRRAGRASRRRPR